MRQDWHVCGRRTGRAAAIDANLWDMTEGNSAPPREVEEMFDRISGVYDGMNLAISGFQEPRWRKRLVKATGIGPGGRALDVACGTGKVTLDLWRAAQPGGSALGIDFSAGMIEIAAGHRAPGLQGLEFRQGDALALPVEDDSFDAATIAYGMRNLADYRQGFAEMARAVRPGGTVVCLEISQPTSLLGRLIAVWFDHVVPLIGRVVGQGDAYAYLARSVKGYPGPERIAGIMRDAGLDQVDWMPLAGGIIVLHTASVPEPPGPPTV
jgi:demethylmenaquinone methyltransferase/2-methoxy-6-polyprenyl-1,4-benzoquinol methylase